MLEYNLKSGLYCFLPNPFQFIVHVSFLDSTLYSLRYFKIVVKRTAHRASTMPTGAC
jgi:hypothetical protein